LENRVASDDYAIFRINYITMLVKCGFTTLQQQQHWQHQGYGVGNSSMLLAPSYFYQKKERK